MTRALLETGNDIFVRYNKAISILNKVRKKGEKPFNKIISSRKPFGLATNFDGFKKNKDGKYNILIHRFGDNGYVSYDQIEKNHGFIKDWKVLVPKASPGDDSYPHLILSKPIVSGPNTCCTETYILVGPFSNEKRAMNAANYMVTSFFRFMVLLAKSTQDVTQKTYVFVPEQNLDERWTDEKLFEKYGITEEEIEFINTLIRPMDVSYE
jgi:site-specific DNA-methyltransferase (adenine-specific)